MCESKFVQVRSQEEGIIVNFNTSAVNLEWGRLLRLFFALSFSRDISRPGYLCFVCTHHPVSRKERGWARCAPPTPWFPLAYLPRVSVAAQRTNLPDKPTLSIHGKPIKAAHSQNMPWEVSFYWLQGKGAAYANKSLSVIVGPRKRRMK